MLWTHHRAMTGGGVLRMERTPFLAQPNNTIHLPAGIYRRGDGMLTEFQYVGLPIGVTGTLHRTLPTSMGTMMLSIRVPAYQGTGEHNIIVEIRLNRWDHLFDCLRRGVWTSFWYWLNPNHALPTHQLGLAPNLPMDDMREQTQEEIRDSLLKGMETILQDTDPNTTVEEHYERY